MIPRHFDDPRTDLEKATRWELYDFAKSVGCTEVKEPMPAMLAVQILRGNGFTRIQIPDRPLGAVSVLGGNFEPPATQTVDALEELARQFAQQQANPDREMSFTELRSELKRRGVKFSRSDKMEVLKAKLNGQQNAA